MSDLKNHVAAVRRFNRFYTRIIGLLSEGINKTPFSLVEARLIHEIGRRKQTTAKDLARDLQIDAGQLSRVVQKLAAKAIVATKTAEHDRRINYLHLTSDGMDAFNILNAVSDEDTMALLHPLTDDARVQLVKNMSKIQGLLDRNDLKPADAPILIRPHNVGELGWLIHRQAQLYNQEYGWDGDFETLIAQIYHEYAAHNTQCKSLWVAEQNDVLVGSIFVLPAPEDQAIAQLRMLYVEPSARGQGLGHLLVKQAVDFARQQNFKAITLWTQDCLKTARKVYQAAGFKLIREESHHSFGVDLNGQYWQLDLKA